MILKPTEIPDVKVLSSDIHADARGFFTQTWDWRQLDKEFVQEGHSRSQQHVLRGLHYQIKQPQGKLVSVAHGTIFDVAVDLRKNSPTFSHWVAKTLFAGRGLWIPPGFAHGFLVLSQTADVLYRCTHFHAPQHERVIRWDDSELNIPWPLFEDVHPVLSNRDSFDAVAFSAAEYFP